MRMKADAGRSRLPEERQKYLEWLVRFDADETLLASNEPQSKGQYCAANHTTLPNLSNWEKSDAFKLAYLERTVEQFASPRNLNHLLTAAMESLRTPEGIVDRQALTRVADLMDKYRPPKPIADSEASLEDLSDEELADLVLKAVMLRGADALSTVKLKVDAALAEAEDGTLVERSS